MSHPGDLPHPGSKSASPPALQVDLSDLQDSFTCLEDSLVRLMYLPCQKSEVLDNWSLKIFHSLL